MTELVNVAHLDHVYYEDERSCATKKERKAYYAGHYAGYQRAMYGADIPYPGYRKPEHVHAYQVGFHQGGQDS